MRLRPRLVAALTVGGLLVAGGVSMQAGAVSEQCFNRQARFDGWDRINPPRMFTSSIVDYAALGIEGSTLVATDGTLLAQSHDGGCSFTQVASADLTNQVPTLTQSGVSLTPTKYTQVAVGPSAGSYLRPDHHVYAVRAAYNTADNSLLATFVSVSGDSGLTFVDGQHGAPIPGAPLRLTIAGGNSPGAAAYLAVRRSGATTADIWSTSDAGATWALASGTAGVAVDDIVADPGSTQVLWGWSSAGLSRSTDGGASFSAVPDVRGPVATAQVVPGTGIVVFMRSGAAWSKSGAGPWKRLHGPVNPTSVAQNDFPHDYTATSGDRLWSGCTSGAPHDITPQNIGNPFKPFVRPFPGTSYGTITVTDRQAFYTATVKSTSCGVTTILPTLSGNRPGVGPIDPGVPLIEPASISPANASLSLRPGASRTLPYALNMPAHPSPLDVFFVVDTTSSMSATINGLRAGISQIVRDISNSGIDAEFGIGDFQDYPGYPSREQPQQTYGAPTDHVYVRDLPVSPPGPALSHAIEGLTLGNGGDESEAALPGIYQAATGKGQARVDALGGASGYWVNPGQQAGFRPDALHVIIVAADTKFHQGGGYPGPSMATTIAALNADNIHLVGLDVSGSDPAGPAADMAKLATATNTRAPAGGIDCNGDGAVTAESDVPAGRPMVCPFTPDGSDLTLAPGIVALLRAIRDAATVHLTATDADGGPVTVTPNAFPRIDLKARNLLHFDLKVACPRTGDSDHHVRVNALVRDQVLATGVVTVLCRGPHKPPPPVPLVVVPPPVPAPAVVPVQPPPPPANPPANPNPNPNPNPQPGAAAESQEDAQLALAVNDEGSDELGTENADEGPGGVSMSMSDHRQTSGTALALSWLVMGCATAATALAVRSRRRTASNLLYAEVRD